MAEQPATATSDGRLRVYNPDHRPMARMKRTGTLSERQYAAAERFAADFYHARREGGFVTTSMARRAKSVSYRISDQMMAARRRLDAALRALTPIGHRLVWHLVGNHDDMNTVVQRMAGLCGGGNRHHVAGMLVPYARACRALPRRYRQGWRLNRRSHPARPQSRVDEKK